MIYRHRFEGSEFSSMVIGLPNPRWALESFTLESELRDDWWKIEPGDVVLDVGAGFGSYTLTALAKGAGLVMAAEPDKEGLFALASNVMINHYGPRTVLLPCMVCDVSGVVVGYDSLTHSGRAAPGMMEHRLAETADNLCLVYSPERLDWLKIDVEGGEVETLLGAQQVLAKLRPKVIVENHVAIRPDVLEQVARLMTTFRYSPEHRTGKGGNDNWTLWRPL